MNSNAWPEIARAENDQLFTVDDRVFTDLFSAHGAILLGHACPPVAEAIARQLETVWLTGGLPTPIQRKATNAIEAFFPGDYHVGTIYSTGMEAAEFAIRVASVTTGRAKLLGFERSMHGKSIATASLGWHNQSWPDAERIERVPFVATHTEQQILQQVEQRLAERTFAALFVEPIQGAGGGHRASDSFYRELERICRTTDTLLVFDEILTGCYRTGSVAMYAAVDVEPDVVLLGKAIGNGYPASVALLRGELSVQPSMLPGSTFAGSPLTCAAIHSTLETITSWNIQQRVQRIDEIVCQAFAARDNVASSSGKGNMILRGSGAFWIIELPSPELAERSATQLFRQGLALGYWGSYLRLMPPATIDVERLKSACAAIVNVANSVLHSETV